MKRVGLIGIGYWGKILLSKLNRISDVKFVCDSKQDYRDKLDLVDWVFVATTNETHYEIVKLCLLKGKNVFCEKPLTLSLQESIELFDIANHNNLKLYVDDVFNYRIERRELHESLKRQNFDQIEVFWSSPSRNPLCDLLYHDLYLLYPILRNKLDIKWPKINNVVFNYSTSSRKKHFVNNINFTHTEKSNDALLEMIESVLENNVNYEFNKEISLFCNKTLERIKQC